MSTSEQEYDKEYKEGLPRYMDKSNYYFQV